jgi:membrane protein DedA with SNARE-associated domain
MAGRLFEFLRPFLDAYGYWTLVVVLLLENAGIPAPGETTLLFVSFLAWSERELHSLFARFIFGIRIIAGPLAGVLRMPWKKFLLFKFLGASVWVSVISLVGYFFGSRWDRLIHWMNRFNIAIAVVAVLVFVLGWWWRRRERTDAGEED